MYLSIQIWMENFKFQIKRTNIYFFLHLDDWLILWQSMNVYINSDHTHKSYPFPFSWKCKTSSFQKFFYSGIVSFCLFVFLLCDSLGLIRNSCLNGAQILNYWIESAGSSVLYQCSQHWEQWVIKGMIRAPNAVLSIQRPLSAPWQALNFCINHHFCKEKFLRVMMKLQPFMDI